jgi:hypothetical protein
MTEAQFRRTRCMINPSLFLFIHKFWISVTEEELEKTKGNLNAIINLIQKKYGHSREVITGILNDLYLEAESTNNVRSKLTNAFHQPR